MVDHGDTAPPAMEAATPRPGAGELAGANEGERNAPCDQVGAAALEHVVPGPVPNLANADRVGRFAYWPFWMDAAGINPTIADSFISHPLA
jgi:hypothetical protein